MKYLLPLNLLLTVVAGLDVDDLASSSCRGSCLRDATQGQSCDTDDPACICPLRYNITDAATSCILAQCEDNITFQAVGAVYEFCEQAVAMTSASSSGSSTDSSVSSTSSSSTTTTTDTTDIPFGICYTRTITHTPVTIITTTVFTGDCPGTGTTTEMFDMRTPISSSSHPSSPACPFHDPSSHDHSSPHDSSAHSPGSQGAIIGAAITLTLVTLAGILGALHLILIKKKKKKKENLRLGVSGIGFFNGRPFASLWRRRPRCRRKAAELEAASRSLHELPSEQPPAELSCAQQQHQQQQHRGQEDGGDDGDSTTRGLDNRNVGQRGDSNRKPPRAKSFPDTRTRECERERERVSPSPPPPSVLAEWFGVPRRGGSPSTARATRSTWHV
ncbi:hypothetical protein F4780DRAFT_104577 [Xylariomycetidae sp. FL0641]|nr:hypothetical protein F4780DRAFT_104577 [Xylariomycetidae sp. FL0641]